jgi:hypothetical protein
MKERYRLFLRRKSVYYAFDNTTKSFQSLKTKDEAEAKRLLMALNEAGKQPAMNLSLARVYLKHSDPMVSERTWQHVLDEIIKLKTGPTQYRWQSAAKDKAFDLIRNRLLIETQPEHFLEVLRKGTVSTNAYLRKTHNFALDMNWLPACVIGIHGVTLHSYRYAWAERAKVAGMPERFAQEALGHNSKAVHRAYAKRALVKIPSLEDYEKKAEPVVPAAASI